MILTTKSYCVRYCVWFSQPRAIVCPQRSLNFWSSQQQGNILCTRQNLIQAWQLYSFRMCADISNKSAVWIFRAAEPLWPEDGNSRFFRDVDTNFPKRAVSHPKTQESRCSLPGTLQILHEFKYYLHEGHTSKNRLRALSAWLTLQRHRQVPGLFCR